MRSVLVIILISLNVVLGYDHYWREYNGTTPSDAIVDKDSVLILAQMPSSERCIGAVPAGLNHSTKKASSECYSKEISTTANIKVLCTKNPERYDWEWVNTDEINATTKLRFVKGGYDATLGDLYFGKIFKSGYWHIGKIHFDYPQHCYFIDKVSGAQIKIKDCMALKYNY